MSLRKKIAYAGRHFTPTWRYGFNLKPTLAWRRRHPALTGEAARIVTELERHGIAITTAERLPALNEAFAELSGAIESLERDWAERIAEARRAGARPEGEKTFLLTLLGARPRLEPASIFARLAIETEALPIANAYFRMLTQLRYYNVWHTLASDSPARESQLWHFDRDDHQILKLFVYHTDVSEDAGAMSYAPGTHRNRAGRAAPDSFLENGVRRWRDEQMEAVMPRAHWLRAIGPRGTVVFADTRGYHKGGHARLRDRVLYTCMFTSAAAQVVEMFERPAQLPAHRDPARAFALTRG
jgi:ectoine hydroxylase-related dioxygenase (phytanoyl-CoA dioxygenase family)